ncbi:YrrS family protein [Oceanobacillus sp. J11TS1]|uniref:YrrS family protein n=1 Tax=Oceanobacillus sp. J11TS1 TaxID=2807191 RepID=UPI001B1CE9CC|nr:YrrS family protein [Oceanobacillus sp. J11TS1]GIO21840.1 putative membrane protein YrrS [Oceanobacillus sp. J11TS1]
MSQTRSNRFEKRRKNTNAITILSIIIGLVIVVFLAVWLFGGNSSSEADTASNASASKSASNEEKGGDAEDDGNGFLITDPNSKDKDKTESGDDDAGEDKKEKDNADKEEDAEEDESKKEDKEDNQYEDREPADPTDSNVKEAYTGDWDPVGTEQEGAHTTNFNDGSHDRIEIKRAVSKVTGLDEGSMIEHWVGNNGPDKVVATVSDSSNSEVYRVFLDWVDGEGWQPTQVEELIENDAGQ